MIIIDEAAAINSRLFFETIVPLLEMRTTSLIAISTPLDEFNFFSKILNMRDDDGNSFFDTVQIGLVCDDCLKLDSHADRLKCPHLKDMLPPWKSASRNERFKKLMIETGNAARGLRENAGVVASDRATVFQRKDIENLFITPKPPQLIDLDQLNIQIPLLFITCDPDSDGSSEMALVAGFINTTCSALPIGAHIVRFT